MNCGCMTRAAASLAFRLTLPEAAHNRPVSTATLEGVTAMDPFLTFIVCWRLASGKTINRPLPVKFDFCPFCGQSAAKPQRVRKEKDAATPVQPKPPAPSAAGDGW
jgi:hypothetical protein